MYSQNGTDQRNPNRIVGVEAWYIHNLIHDVKKLHSCELVVEAQSNKLLITDSLIKLSEGRFIVLEEKNKIKDLQLNLAKKELKESNEFYRGEIKAQRKKIVKITLVAIAEGALILLLILTDK